MKRTIPLSVGAAMMALLLGGCITQAKEPDLALDKTSVAGAYRVTLVPPDHTPAINQMHSWKLRLQDPSGAPVTGARFVVDGGMPQHGHGLPTQPRITREIEAGTYQLDGMKFSMTGWWELKLGVASELGSDTVTFNMMVNNAVSNR